MASGGRMLCEDQFLCSVCLAMFKEPVSTPCGHNFCKFCIEHYWETTSICQCPLCKTTFPKRPNLKTNTLISELATQFTMSHNVDFSSYHESSASGEVVCEICDYPKLKAVISCLECLTSYCKIHLEPHDKAAGLMRHTLIEPDEDLYRNVCRAHSRRYTLFCEVDKVTMCVICAGMHHKSHTSVSVHYEYRKKQTELVSIAADLHRMIQERLQKVKDIKLSKRTNQEEAQNACTSALEDFSALVSAIQRVQAEHMEEIEEKHRAADDLAEGLIAALQQEIAKLQGTQAQVSDLMHTENHVIFLQNFPTGPILPETRDWSTIDINTPLRIDSLKKSVKKPMSQFGLLLDQISKDRFGDFEKLQLMQQYKFDFSLDPETANHSLILSGNGKEVRYGGFVKQKLHKNPKTFTVRLAVLGNKSFSTGKIYYEVNVGEKTEWDLGVADESLPRKSDVVYDPECKLWAIMFKIDACKTFCSPDVLVYQGKMEKVGVFVDYEAGLVSFYDVKAACLIYSFTGCNFTKKLYPYLNPCDNECGSNLEPLIIVPV